MLALDCPRKLWNGYTAYNVSSVHQLSIKHLVDGKLIWHTLTFFSVHDPGHFKDSLKHLHNSNKMY